METCQSSVAHPDDQQSEVRSKKPLILINRVPGDTHWSTECKLLKRHASIADPTLVELYPKQIKSIVNRKKVDILKVSTSLKVPGKRNYKTQIVSMRRLG